MDVNDSSVEEQVAKSPATPGSPATPNPRLLRIAILSCIPIGIAAIIVTTWATVDVIGHAFQLMEKDLEEPLATLVITSGAS